MTISNGGNLKQGLQAGAQAYLTSYISSAVDNGGWFVRGMVGGAVSYATGGKFGHGFVSAAIRYEGNNIAVGAIIRGTVSAATGGKFANGAITGAFAVASRNRSAPKTNDTLSYPSQADENTIVISTGLATQEEREALVKTETESLKDDGLISKDHAVYYVDEYAVGTLNEKGQIVGVKEILSRRVAVNYIKSANQDEERILLAGQTGRKGPTVLYRSAVEAGTIEVKDVYFEDGQQYVRRLPRTEVLMPRQYVRFTILHEFAHHEGVRFEKLADNYALKKLNYPGY